MSNLFFDSSALVKRYAPEVGSSWVTVLSDASSGHVVLIAEITIVEVAAALAAKARMPGGITPSERDAALGSFVADCGTRYTLVGADKGTIDLAVDLTQKHALRAYDALQVATALVVQLKLATPALGPLTIISADNDVIKTAQAEGLATDNPLLHP